MQQQIIIDGSLNEGGGQMLRSSLALSVLLQKQFRMINIRSNRPNPGINNQLLNQINLISRIIKSEVEGAKLGSQEVTFTPLEKFIPQNLTCQAQTAQSITLILQSLLPISLNTKTPVVLSIHGGTYMNHSPTINAWQEIFLPLLKQMGIDCEIEVTKEGYFPQGGGLVNATINPIAKLNAINMTKIQKINRLTCTYLLNQPQGVLQFDNQFVNALKGFSENLQLEIKSDIKLVNSKKFKKCYGITLFSHSNINSYDHTIINEADRQIQETVDTVIQNAQKSLSTQSCLDEHHQDQLILLMALAEGQSEILIGEPSLHTKSLIYVINNFLPECKIQLKELLRVEGVNYKF